MSDCTIDNTEAIARLRTVANQIGEIIDWASETDGSLEAIQRIQSIQIGLRQITVGLIEHHLSSCVATAVAQDGKNALSALDEIRDMFRCVNWIDL